MEAVCPNCNGKIHFVPEEKKFLCEYCGKLFSVEKLSTKASFVDNNYSEFVCNNCGSKIVTDSNALIASCAYCGSNQIQNVKMLGEFCPEKIIPFQCESNRFQEIFKYYMATKPLAPNAFVEQIKVENVKGIYVPFVIYNVECDSHARGECADKVLSCHDDECEELCFCKYFEMNYEINGVISFDTSCNIDDIQMKNIGPFDESKMIDFNPAYLSGFFAFYGDEDNINEKLYEELIYEANESISEKITEIHGSVQHKITDLETGEQRTGHIYNGGINKINIKKYDKKHVLFPVYIYNCLYKGKSYKFLINGQTGKMIGDAPVQYKNVLIYTLKHGFYFYLFLFFLAFFLIYKSKGALLFIVLGWSVFPFATAVVLKTKFEEEYRIHLDGNKNNSVDKKITLYSEYSKEEYESKYQKDYLKKCTQVIQNDKLVYNNVSENVYSLERKDNEVKNSTDKNSFEK